jgi:hypothetical protein
MRATMEPAVSLTFDDIRLLIEGVDILVGRSIVREHNGTRRPSPSSIC